MKNLLKRYAGFLIAAVVFGVLLILFPIWRGKALASIAFQTKTLILVLPPIFLLLGLMDVWVPREQMVKYMGAGSGVRGPILAFLLGSFAAGPLYGAFPFATVLMKKGASLLNILIFIGAWSTTKIPMLLFEISALGPRFALSRLAVDLVGIIIIAFAIKATLPKKTAERLYAAAALID